MEKIKRPHWDPCKESEPIEFKKDILSPDFSIDEGITVTAYYKGKMIMLRVENILSKTEFKAIITGFEPPAEEYENLSINDKVAIDKDHICGMLRTV